MPKLIFWGSLLLCAFLIDKYGPWWLQALAFMAALGWFVVASWWEEQKNYRR